ncbi:AAA family ATPase [Candidatus Pelagibacter ubique]|jgi:chromosome segregation protein|uniref:Chromosome partition protein Smc n=1 Tax=Pelagibacter ubique (strain HTCC1002) TaxID=314261 RepID=Q1V0M1_PELU1|nr:AAA family ATPase [Candidatus Pelagibacter ubique]EAS85207.1 chromosome segregation protein SMC family protein [Candidatus Pelagibacter ubique HTCC1002]MDA7453783.1 AAA family ATPase [Candidatus Pelagibacter ubique]MDA7468399.1 AAA family ATPase [Candidatus Pelagibacter ubique]MDA7477295.1 AAA family ATPase [Candidatus Pelagibacter ubique]MDB9714441.1 AAA family ATPase [Candidatus Pelagibacter ubique]
MEFKKIQLNGFKSFAEKTNFLIEHGLTGIVGPNGCGKSNIVESLRWVMGETSAKSMRGSGMEDVIFNGTSNKSSKNIAEVSISVDNASHDGPMQYKDLDHIEVRRKIEKDKGSKFYINDKEVRARDAQMFFADLSTGAHSPSMISQGRIGALVTAKPTDRRAILEEAANISGLHVRRHEAELRLNAAETNLKRADELRRQQEKQLANLQKQAEEATKYKLISEEIKKIEAGLYYLKLLDIDNEIRIENEINNEAEGEVSNFNQQIAQFENLIKTETDKVSPLREKNIENLSKIQRLNLELQNLDEENVRTQDEIENIKKSLKTIEEDIDREKGIVIDANSNERRLKEEKAELIEIDSKYFETEKLSNEDLEKAKNLLKDEQKSVDEIINIFADGNINIAIGPIKNVKNTITRAKELINNNEINQALTLLDRCQIEIDGFLDNLEDEESKKKLSNINEKNENIKLLQEKYADSFSKNQSIKKESVKRNERIKAIESEVESWKNLLSNSEKMVSELTERKNKLLSQLNERDQQPKAQAERKGQITEGLRISQNEKIENEKIIEETDKKINSLRLELNDVQERSIQIRERKASSGATVEGLKKRKEDLLERVSSELNLEENDILENSNLNGVEELPDSVAQEDALDEKKREREKLGSVNLRADEETSKYEIEIKKMEQDREDLVSAIIKLKESINELNQKGRERLLEAFEKVNRKFNEVYTKLFNGGNAKLELVDSDDPLEAGLEMLVSPPGKRLQSITLLSGGEQALTALSLIFAVFLTNPSPICVLDEVDAPLDDANVTRFCGLLDDLTKITDTKFIIVTHHALTMSKMNRLYGVTMPEKGISQLVAVDLQKAESMVA